MLTDEDARALIHCDMVRTLYPLRFLQVRPMPGFPDNVQLRVGSTAKWQAMHVNDALAFVRNTVRSQRKAKRDAQTMAARTRRLRNALDQIKRRHEAVQGREREWTKWRDYVRGRPPGTSSRGR
jgi:hypothetical protein